MKNRLVSRFTLGGEYDAVVEPAAVAPAEQIISLLTLLPGVQL
jgi:hypothetical protein